jgi:3-oxoacyl-[acyl-carrier-protein] synthase-3
MEQKSDLYLGYPLPIKIAGLGCYFPKRAVPSRELEDRFGLKEGWCMENLGVQERRWVEDETLSFMGAEAAKEAVENANMDLEDIDLIINASATGNLEKIVPDGAALIQYRLNLEDSGIPCFTLQNSLLSFLSALEASASMLAAGRYENILVISTEVFSSNLDSNNPYVYGLFSDGAAAAVLTPAAEDEPGSVHKIRLETYGSKASYLQSLVGLAMLLDKGINNDDIRLKMETKSFYESGNKYLRRLLEKLFTVDEKYNLDDIKFVIPQQMGKNFLQYLEKEINIPNHKIIQVIQRLGFCGAASIPTAMYEAVKEKKIVRGDLLLLAALGAGLSVGGIIMTY